MMVVVLVFFFCEDEDLPDADPSSSSQSDEFRKALTANETVHLLPGVCWIWWYSVTHPCFYFDRLVLEGAARRSILC
jgi:hypothetical protein